MIVGYNMIAITSQTVLVNLYFALRDPVKHAYRHLKRCYIFRKKTKGKTVSVAKNMAKRKLRTKMSTMKSFVLDDLSA